MNFLSLDIYRGTYRGLLEIIQSPTQKTLVFTPNPEILVRAHQDHKFLSILQQATHNTPDANGLYVGALMQDGYSFFRAGLTTFFQKQYIREKYGELIKGSDLTRDLFLHASQSHQKIMVIDSYRIIEPKNAFEVRKKEIQSNLFDLLHTRFPTLDVELVFDGEYDPCTLAQMIQDQHISYVFSCLGMKKQEERLLQIWEHLPEDTPVLGLGVGASIDFLLGLQSRAPLVIQRLGLEWLYRLILEPRKRWKRIYDAFVVFPRLIKKSLQK